MTISQRQFTLLSEMGISLWQRRSEYSKPNDKKIEAFQPQNKQNEITTKIEASTAQPNSQPKEATTKEIKVNESSVIKVSELTNQPLFNDILLALQLAPENIEVANQQLCLKQLTWQFVDDNNYNIELIENLLTTPNLQLIKQTPKLKQQLWQTLQPYCQ